MLRRRTRSTLFPYTTLFRSDFSSGPEGRRPSGFPGNHAFLLTGPGYPGAGLDRKSTRLNSSHANISYAVFSRENIMKACQRQALDAGAARGTRRDNIEGLIP